MYEYYITPEEYEIAEKNGICKHTLDYRIREAAWDKKRAITEQIKGDKYKKYYEIARKNGIKENTFRKRLSYGMSLEEASTKPVDKDHQSKRKYPKEILIIAEQNGIKRNTLISRLRLGWSLEDATTIKPNRKIRNESWRKDNELIFNSQYK